MTLAELIDGLSVRALRGDRATEIEDVAYDSREAGPGTAFVCVSGLSSDGHDFAAAAVEAGASALIVERRLDLGVPEVEVESSREAMGPIAARLFGEPSTRLAVAAVTGTNGKTTTAFLVRGILESVGMQCGLIGTIKRVVGGVEEAAERTTPESVDLQRTFRRMLDGGDQACVIEVSSHALRLGRAAATRFEAAAFTNLSQDHLDFHPDMEDYFSAKRLLFLPPPDSAMAPPANVAVNVDDQFGTRLATEIRLAGHSRLTTFSATGAAADLIATGVEFDNAGVSFRLQAGGISHDVSLPLPGHFNVENALAATALSAALGIEISAIVAALASAAPVPGRMEPIDQGQDFAVLVDYAHSPDSLENVLQASRKLTGGRLICVFGCGGDRDRSKRPLMGRTASELADHAIVTSDNPRSEDPEAIIAEVLTGVEPGRAEAIADRREAIAAAMRRAEAGDLVVVAGKGHEQGQEFEAARKIPFDDREVAREELRALARGEEGKP